MNAKQSGRIPRWIIVYRASRTPMTHNAPTAGFRSGARTPAGPTSAKYACSDGTIECESYRETRDSKTMQQYLARILALMKAVLVLSTLLASRDLLSVERILNFPESAPVGVVSCSPMPFYDGPFIEFSNTRLSVQRAKGTVVVPCIRQWTEGTEGTGRAADHPDK